MRLVDLSPDIILTTDTGVIETSGILERYFDKVSRGERLEPVYVADGRVVTGRPFYVDEQRKVLKESDLGLVAGVDVFLRGRVYVGNVQVPIAYAEGLFARRVTELEGRVRSMPWFLLDGNHRALACSLARKDVPCRVLESDEDVREVRLRSERGEWPQLFAEGDSILDVVRSWEMYVLGTASSRFGEDEARACTVSERRDWLYERKAIPQSIIDYVEKSRR